MMFPKIEYGNNSSTSNSNNGQLLHDIEEISKALFLHKTLSRASKPLSGGRSESVGKTRIPESNSISNPIWKEDQQTKEKKSSAIWNWKKPLKALSHIRQHRSDCCFFLYVHSITGLPVNFEDFSLCLYWEKKDEILRTQPAKVSKGIAEFDETLTLKCCVHSRRNGPHSSAKYEEKLSLLYASLVEAPGLDLGKHWIDLTRLLPLTVEELEGEKSSGKWTTSYNLTGKARGATVNVSFGFSFMRDNISDSNGHMKLAELINLTKNLSKAVEHGASLASNGNGVLRRVGSVPSNLSSERFHATQSIDLKTCHEVLLSSELELSKSISFLCQKLDEGNLRSSTELSTFSEHKAELKPKTDLEPESAGEINENEYDSTDFIVIERGIEMSNEEWLKPQEGTVEAIVDSPIETINVDEFFMDDENSKYVSKGCTDEIVVGECEYEENSVWTKESTEEEMESVFNSLLTSASAESGSSLATSEFLGHESFTETQPDYKGTRMMRKSLSLDDVTESVANDFLNMLGIHTPSRVSSDNDDPKSPRGQLLREFEKEALASGNFLLDFDAKDERVEFDFSSVFQNVEVKHDELRQPLNIRRNAQLLEDLETAELMQEWGLNEKAFQSSPRMYSTGFGSPIQLPPEEPLVLTPLGEGLGPVIKTRDGGYLRSMKPSTLTNAKHVASLIMQISNPIVVPAEMGSDIMEILQHMASVGVEKLSMQAHKLMPLEDITGKTMQQVAQEAMPRVTLSERQSFLQGSFSVNTGSSYMTLEDLIPSAMDGIEALSIEGLRIQSGMSTEEPPSSITPRSICKRVSASQGKDMTFGGFLSLEGTAGLQTDMKDTDNDVEDLMDLSITLDEWLRFDIGLTGDKDQICEHTVKILVAHHANCIDFGGRLTVDVNQAKPECGLFGNNLTIAFMVQLRDLLRNNEPVGVPMLAILQVERSFVHENFDDMLLETENEEESTNEAAKGTFEFRFIELHLTGLDTEPGSKKQQLWGTTIQRQSGARWLLGSGMGKTNKHPSLSKSMAMVQFSPQSKSKDKFRDFLWSISSCHPSTQSSNWEELSSPMQHIRNPNVAFPDDTIR